MNAAIIGAVVVLAVAMNLVHNHGSAWDWLVFGLVPLVLGVTWLLRRVRT